MNDKLEQIFDKHHEGYAVYNKDEIIKELLILFNVIQQRELLKKWWKYFDEESVAINCNDEEREQVINDFFNCG